MTVQRGASVISGKVIATYFSNCTVRFTDGSLQKFLWGNVTIVQGA